MLSAVKADSVFLGRICTSVVNLAPASTHASAFVYVIAWFAVVFGINSTSNAEIIVRGETMLSHINTLALQSRFNCHQNSAYKPLATEPP